MNVIDAVFILIILMFGVVGFKRGVFKQLVMSLGIFVVCILAWYLKTPIANFITLHIPFFNLSNYGVMIPVLNILFFQTVGFCLIFGILMIILQVIINCTSIFEKILKATVILAIPSKILGFIVGIIEGYIIVFIIAFFLSQPAINIDIVNQSKLKPFILNNTIILSNTVENTYNTMKDIYELKNKYEKTEEKDYESLSRDCIDTMLKYKIVTPEFMKALKENNKLKIQNIDSIINKYVEE